MPALEDLVGRTFGPFEVEASRDRVAEFADVTGDDPALWRQHAPPLFASAALFAVAPAFLENPGVVRYTKALIHSEQSFRWHRALSVGERLRVSGAVDAVRARGALNLVTFRLGAESDAGHWLDGESVFLMADVAAAESPHRSEPPVDERPPVDPPASPGRLPPVGDPISELRCGASRMDLVRYAAVTRDWNPIHWDHESARAAGLPGTIVHGLLMAAWLGRAAGRYSSGAYALSSMTLRFRKPLRPGDAAVVTGSVADVVADGADLDLVLESGDDRLVTGRVRVTR